MANKNREKQTEDAIRELPYQVVRQTLNLIRRGRPVFDGNQQPVVNQDGKQVYRPPSHQDLRFARDLLNDNGVRIADDAPADDYERALRDLRARNQIEQERDVLARVGEG